MIKQYPQAPRIGKANLCHSDSSRIRYMTQVNQNFSLTCDRNLGEKKNPLFLDVVNVELREAMALSVVTKLSVAMPLSHQQLLPPTPLGKKKRFIFSGRE